MDTKENDLFRKIRTIGIKRIFQSQISIERYMHEKHNDPEWTSNFTSGERKQLSKSLDIFHDCLTSIRKFNNKLSEDLYKKRVEIELPPTVITLMFE